MVLITGDVVIGLGCRDLEIAITKMIQVYINLIFFLGISGLLKIKH
jgi:hypothetical protein